MYIIHDVKGLIESFDEHCEYSGYAAQHTTNRFICSDLLMSADNKKGMTLEALLQKVIEEVEAKTRKIAVDDSDEARCVTANNNSIVHFLDLALKYQRNSMDLLAKKGPEDVDKPRMGSGSEGCPLVTE